MLFLNIYTFHHSCLVREMEGNCILGSSSMSSAGAQVEQGCPGSEGFLDYRWHTFFVGDVVKSNGRNNS